MDTISPARQDLERLLLDTGTMAPEWAAAFRAVPRHRFLPEVMWPFDPATGQSLTVDRRTDPETWQRWAEADAPITIQWDDGRSDAPGGVYTSSASMPSVVFAMLGDLDARPGMTVLEVGTGTGWNAALLAHRLGEDAVTTVEVDPAVAETARERLSAAGFRPTVVAGDGLAGDPANAPYDRIIVTCGLRQIPGVWIDQARPGGVIVAPWGTDYSPQDAVVRLVVAEDRHSASGHFTLPAQFMKARSQRLEWPQHEDYVRDWPGEESTTHLPRHEVFPDAPYATVSFVLGLLVPDCTHTVHDQGDGSHVAWLYGLTDRSWAAIQWDDTRDGHGTVYQSGPRRLWDEITTAHRQWDEMGRPGRDRFGLTVTPDGTHQIWIDEPDHTLSD